MFIHKRKDRNAVYIYLHNETQFELSDPLLGLMAGSSGIRARWAIKINGRFEAERLPASSGPPSGGRAASSVPYIWQ